jgi:hypothetical protein
MEGKVVISGTTVQQAPIVPTQQTFNRADVLLE